MALTQQDLEQIKAYLDAQTPRVRIPELPPATNYGVIAGEDKVPLYMNSINKTVWTTLSSIAEALGAGASAVISTPSLSLLVISDNQINATWGSVAHATTYKLYRSTINDRATASLIYTGSNLSFNDTGRTAATRFYYWLQATGSGYVDSGYSNANVQTTGQMLDTTPPVLSSAVINDSNKSQIILTYNETLTIFSNADTNQFQVQGKAISFVSISGTLVTITVNTPFGGGEAVLLSYSGSQIKDIAGNLAAQFQNQPVTNNINIQVTQLTTPSLSAVVVSENEVTLNWPDIQNESSYIIEKSTDGTTWTQIAELPPNEITLPVTNLSPATTYYFRLKAKGTGLFADSLYSTTSVTTIVNGGGTNLGQATLTFSATVTDEAAGVVGTLMEQSPTAYFKFTALSNRLTAGGTMSMYTGAGGGVLIGVIDFSYTYLNKPFTFRSPAGTIYNGSFVDGPIFL